MDIKQLIYIAIMYIHDNFSETISVADISARAYLSPSYFAAAFRIFTGFTVKNYFNRYRLYRAATELISGEKRIIDIAFDVGFLSQESFTRSFSKIYGITPAQFRLLKPDFEIFPPHNIWKLKEQTQLDLLDGGTLVYGK